MPELAQWLSMRSVSLSRSLELGQVFRSAMKDILITVHLSSSRLSHSADDLLRRLHPTSQICSATLKEAQLQRATDDYVDKSHVRFAKGRIRCRTGNALARPR